MKKAVSLVAGLLCVATAFWAISRPGEPSAPGDAGRRGQALDVRIVHDGSCLEPCRDDRHWRMRAGSVDLETPADLQAVLKSEPPARQVVIQGPDAAPWGLVQRVMEECGDLGLHKIEWMASGAPLKVSNPRRSPTEGHVILEEIRIFMKWDPRERATLRKCGNRGQVESDERLMEIVLQMSNDYAKAGRPGFPFLIDATPDVPWKDVIHVVGLLRRNKLEPILFERPFEIRRK